MTRREAQHLVQEIRATRDVREIRVDQQARGRFTVHVTFEDSVLPWTFEAVQEWKTDGF